MRVRALKAGWRMSQQYVKDEYPLSDVTARIIAAAVDFMIDEVMVEIKAN
jgi:hypothetical protein